MTKNTMNDRRTALLALRAIAPDTDELIEMINDYCDEADFLDAGTNAALEALMGGEGQEFADITLALELLDELDADLARRFAEANELCARCFSDIEVCDC